MDSQGAMGQDAKEGPTNFQDISGHPQHNRTPPPKCHILPHMLLTLAQQA